MPIGSWILGFFSLPLLTFPGDPLTFRHAFVRKIARGVAVLRASVAKDYGCQHCITGGLERSYRSLDSVSSVQLQIANCLTEAKAN